MEKEFKKWCDSKIKEYPHLEEDIVDLYFYAIQEIESGESPTGEISLAKRDIEELISDAL